MLYFSFMVANRGSRPLSDELVRRGYGSKDFYMFETGAGIQTNMMPQGITCVVENSGFEFLLLCDLRDLLFFFFFFWTNTFLLQNSVRQL